MARLLRLRSEYDSTIFGYRSRPREQKQWADNRRRISAELNKTSQELRKSLGLAGGTC
jgi:hypothetical protein